MALPPKPVDWLPLFQFVPTIHKNTYPAIDPLKANLSAKYVLITGASRGIGRATALSFAKAGASGIAILARSDLSSLVVELNGAAQHAGRSPPTILPLTADQTDEVQVDKAAAKVKEKFGRLDILINNAGYLETWKPVAESEVQDWWRSFEVNVKGVYLMDRAFIPLLLVGGDKTIITVSSFGAIAVEPTASGYQTAKQAQIRLNNFLVAEYGAQGLLAYSAHPGGVVTDLAKGMPEEQYKWLQDSPELAADTFVFLTQEKRDWLNDRFLCVNWDMEEFLARKDSVVQNDLLRYEMRTSE